MRNIFQIAVLTSPYSLNCTCSHTFFAKIGILKANKVECRKSFGSDIPMWYIVFGDRIATHSCIHLFSCLKYSWVNLFWMVIYFESIHTLLSIILFHFLESFLSPTHELNCRSALKYPTQFQSFLFIQIASVQTMEIGNQHEMRFF